MSNISQLYLFGKELINKYDLIKMRKEFQFILDDIKDDYTIINFIKTNLLLNNYDYEIIRKQTPDNGLNWHLDDAQVITTNKEPEINKDRYIKLSDKKYIYRNKVPIYTIIFYLSTYKKDFNGGILRFCDDKEIKSQSNHGIIFDSREIHMVTHIKSGIRNVIVCKCY